MDEQPVQLVDVRADCRYRGSSATRRLRVRAGGHRVDLHVLRGPVLLAPGDGPQAQDEGDWAEEVASLLEGRYADCEKITLVCDNLNTHTPGAFYEASCAGAGVGQASLLHAEARELVKRACYTPKHGSWLNIAENELRIRQCLRHRRLGDLETLQAEAWSVDVNERQRGVDWES